MRHWWFGLWAGVILLGGCKTVAAKTCKVDRLTLELLRSSPNDSQEAWQQHCRQLALYLRPGPQLDPNQAAERLSSLGYFQGVTCHRPTPQDIACTMQPRPLVVDTRVEGSLPLALLRDDIRRRVFLRAGTIVQDTGEAVRRQAERVRSYLRGEGYFDSNVRAYFDPVGGALPNLGVRLTVELEVGQTALVRKVDLIGNPNGIDARSLQGFFKHTWVFFLGQSRFRPAGLEDDAERAAAYLAQHGYPGAVVRASFAYDRPQSAVDLSVSIQSGPKLMADFAGNTHFSDGDLRDMLTFERNHAIDLVEVDNSHSAIEEAYQRHGFDDVSITTLVRDNNNVFNVTFTISEGTSRKVSRVRFTGNTSISSRRLESSAKLLTQPSGILATHYVTAHVNHDLAALRRVYHAAGFGDVQVDASRRTLPDGSLEVMFSVVEGAKRLVEDVQLEGLPSDMSTSTLIKQLSLAPGAPYDASKTDSDLDQIRTALAAQGYLQSEVEVSQNVDSIKVRLRYNVTAHAQSRRGGVMMRGNLRTSATIIEDELQLSQGKPLDAVTLGSARRRLRGLNIFNDVQLQPLVSWDGDPNTWLLIAIQERDVRTLDAVLTFSTDDLFTVGADFRDRNIFGRAVSLDLELRLSNASQFIYPELRIGNVDRLSAKLRIPRPLTLPFDTEYTGLYQYQDYPFFVYRQAGGTASVMRPLLDRNACRYCPSVLGKFSYEMIAVKYVEKTDGPIPSRLLPPYVPTATIGRLVPSVQIDRRDQPLDPHAGYAWNIRTEYAHPDLALFLRNEATAFWRLLTDAQLYFSLGSPEAVRFDSDTVLGGPLVLALSAQYGAAGPLPWGGEVPASETYAYGGDFSVRGLANRASSLALLADYMIVGSGELRWYVYRLGIGVFQIAGFIDVGTVADHLRELFTQTTVTIGPAVRYVTPVGPLSLAYGVPLQIAPELLPYPDSAPPYGRLHFTFGYSF